MTKVFNWNESFPVGISMVDDQHLKLVDLINDVGEVALTKQQPDPEKLKAACNAMLDYTHIHFRDEDAMIKSVGLTADQALYAAKRQGGCRAVGEVQGQTRTAC